MTLPIRQQLRDTLINGKFPSKLVHVKNISLKFIFTDEPIDSRDTISDYVEFLSTFVRCRTPSGQEVSFTSLPGVYFYDIRNAYAMFQQDTLRILLDDVKEFSTSNESRSLWIAYTHSTPAHVLSIDKKLNLIQRYWITFCASDAQSSKMKLITDVFEAAKPWLDKELYSKIKENEENTRENAFFDDEGYDASLRAKAKEVAAKQSSSCEGDIVVIEEEE